MADGSFPGLVSRDRNTNAQTNAIWVRLTDDTTAVTLTGGSVNVNVSNTVTVSAADLDIRNLVQGAANDRVTIYANTVKDGTGTDYIPVVDADGQLQVDVLTMPALSIDFSFTDDSAFTVGTSKVGAVGMLADETAPDSVDEGDVGIPRMTLDRKQLMVIVDPTTDSQRWKIDSNGYGRVDIAAQTLTAVKVSKDANANSETNPIYVYQVKSVVTGTEIHNYDTSTVASDTADNHDYTVTGTTFFLKSVIVSGSGSVKFEIQTGPVATLVTKAVGFLTGRQGDTQQVFFDPPIEVPVASTGTVRVIRTNRQGTSADVYSTIIGNDV